MDKEFGIIFYNTVREFHNRYASKSENVRPMHKEEVVFYFAHLRTGIKHARWLEMQLDEKIAGVENALYPPGDSKGPN
jgi:hypothetical protein